MIKPRARDNCNDIAENHLEPSIATQSLTRVKDHLCYVERELQTGRHHQRYRESPKAGEPAAIRRTAGLSASTIPSDRVSWILTTLQRLAVPGTQVGRCFIR